MMKQKLLLFLLALQVATGVKADDLDYFALTAHGRNVSVGLTAVRQDSEEKEVVENFLQYSFDKNEWNTLSYHLGRDCFDKAKGEESGFIITIGADQTVYFRACSDMQNLMDVKFCELNTGVDNGTLTASGNIMSLLAPTCNSTELGEYAFRLLFSNFTVLTSAKDLKLPSSALASACYFGMFEGCTNLVEAPVLPATTLAADCYGCMFENCTKLNKAPYLPADMLVDHCYYQMFSCCPLITEVYLGAKAIADESCVYSFVLGGSGTFYITEELDKSEDKNYLIQSPFYPNWTTEVRAHESLRDYFTLTASADQNVDVTLIPITQNGVEVDKIDNYIQYSSDKIYWTNVSWDPHSNYPHVMIPQGQSVYFRAYEQRPTLKVQFLSTQGTLTASGNIMSLLDPTCNSTELGEYAFDRLFLDNTSLKSAKYLKLPEQTAMDCYYAMFYGCKNLEEAPCLPATDLKSYCYQSMFEGCKSLAVAPELPATELSSGCYYDMFKGCESLTDAPELPATKLVSNCYQSMFEGCKSLTVAPELPATKLVSGCYQSMFADCKNLEKVTLSATENIMANFCLKNWLLGVTTDGVLFIEDVLLNWLGDNVSVLNLPASWITSQFYLTANQDPDNKGHYYATFYDSKHSWKVETDRAKAYAGELDEDDASLSLIALDGIPNDYGVVLHSTNSAKTAKSRIKLVYTEDEIEKKVADNCLKGTDKEMDVPADRAIYILSYGQDGLGFYKPKATDKLGAHKAYLSFLDASAARSVRMVFDDDETAGVTRVSEDKTDTDIIYNLSGQRIDRLQKGINNVNGKKVLIK